MNMNPIFNQILIVQGAFNKIMKNPLKLTILIKITCNNNKMKKLLTRKFGKLK